MLALPWLLAGFQIADAQTLIWVMNEGSVLPWAPSTGLFWGCGTFSPFLGTICQRSPANWLSSRSQSSWTFLSSPLERRRPLQNVLRQLTEACRFRVFGTVCALGPGV